MFSFNVVDFFTSPKFNKRIIVYIKSVGRTPIKEENLDKRIATVLEYMRQFPKYLSVQRACCRTISNICMDIEWSKKLVTQYNAHVDVMNALQEFYNKDWRLCGLACSAMWNMTRSSEARELFNPSSIALLMKVLTEQYKKKRRCILKTCLGSLSNLSLNDKLKQKVGQLDNLLPLLVMIQSNSADVLVSETAAGLLANLAVDDNLGHCLVYFGAIGAIKQMFKNEFDHRVFLRNTTAALSNCSTSPLFIEASIENKIVEDLYQLMGEDNSINTLIGNSLTALGANPFNKTTSFHLASKHGFVEIFKRLMIENEEEADIDFNSKDSNDRTMISYAIQSKNSSMIAFLIHCGANVGTEKIPIELEHIIKFSQERAENVKKEYEQVLIETLSLNLDIVMMISTYLTPYSLMLGKYGTGF